jgi:NhaC family Na+:H+ antiporter
MLAYNVFIYGDDSLGGSNQFILLMGGAVEAIVGVVKGDKFEVRHFTAPESYIKYVPHT